jgi:hypothetical protein
VRESAGDRRQCCHFTNGTQRPATALIEWVTVACAAIINGCTYEYATVPTSMYARSAPRGPAPCSADPDPRNKPVPIVPAICTRQCHRKHAMARRRHSRRSCEQISDAINANERRVRKKSRDKHLDMALLQTTLDTI